MYSGDGGGTAAAAAETEAEAEAAMTTELDGLDGGGAHRAKSSSSGVSCSLNDTNLKKTMCIL